MAIRLNFPFFNNGRKTIVLLILVASLPLVWTMSQEANGLARQAFGRELDTEKREKDSFCKQVCWNECEGDKEVCDAIREHYTAAAECNSCITYMHIRNPLSICLIILLIVLILGGVGVAVWFMMRKQGQYNPNHNQRVMFEPYSQPTSHEDGEQPEYDTNDTSYSNQRDTDDTDGHDESHPAHKSKKGHKKKKNKKGKH